MKHVLILFVCFLRGGIMCNLQKHWRLAFGKIVKTSPGPSKYLQYTPIILVTLSHSYEGLEVAILNPLRGIDSRLNRPWAPTFQHVIGARPRGDSKDGSQRNLTKKMSAPSGCLHLMVCWRCLIFRNSNGPWDEPWGAPEPGWRWSPNELVEWIYSWGPLVVECLNMIGHGITLFCSTNPAADQRVKWLVCPVQSKTSIEDAQKYR